MTKIVFTPNLSRHIDCEPVDVEGRTVRDVLDVVFAANPRLRGYVLDDQGGLRRHMSVFVGGQQIRDRHRQSDTIEPDAVVYVAQALSGG